MTTRELNALELAAGMAAAQAAITANVPAWERRMIPEAALEAAVAAVVQAVDDVRDRAAASQPEKEK